MKPFGFLTVLLLFTISVSLFADETPQAEDVEAALIKAVRFFHSEVGSHGGYLWQYSGDLTLREAEGKIWRDTLVWVQPPGTPTIGEAFLDAYEATGDKVCLDAALDAADVLVLGQMRTGGWAYQVELAPEFQGQWGYRRAPTAKARRWQKVTVLDDDTTPAAIRFLARLDKMLEFKDPNIHDAALYALKSVLLAQYPNGSWFGWWEFYPKPFSEKEYPVREASYPEDWPRKPGDSPVKYPARYILNDDIVPDMLGTLLDVWNVYEDEQYLAAAKKAGDFLILAQMPDPQPAWAQHYDIDMYPCWGRKFEPPAITGAESQTVLESLLMLYRRTGEEKYLEPVPRALAYFKQSLLPDGSLSRFYELQTNNPLFFNRNYELTYNSDDTPSRYKFIWSSRLDRIEAEYQRLLAANPASLAVEEKPTRRNLTARVAKIIKSLDQRGAWVERGRLRFHNIAPKAGVINCQTFADNIHTLSQFLIASRGRRVKTPVTTDVAHRVSRIHYLSSAATPGPQGDSPQAGRREGDRLREGNKPREGDKPRSDLREGDKSPDELGGFRPQTEQEKALYEMILQLQREVKQLRREINRLKGQKLRSEEVPGESRPPREGDQPRRQREREGANEYPRDGEGRPRTGPREGG